MSELNFDRGDDWDLKAIVKGQAKVSNITTDMDMDTDTRLSYSWLQEYYHNQHNNNNNTNNNNNATHHLLLDDQLHQICTPNISSPQIPDSTMIVATTDGDEKLAEFPTTMVPKTRRNKHKKTSVHQAAGDRVAFDKWNWRKYGEKVIKGSPHPRSYYRCSSNAGGCLARKQVEQSCTDSGKFLITYIDDHTHPYPSHRPSQAGRTSRRLHASSIDMSISNTTKTIARTSSAPLRAKDTVHVHWDEDFDELFAGLEGLEMDILCDTSLFSDQYRCPSNVA